MDFKVTVSHQHDLSFLPTLKQRYSRPLFGLFLLAAATGSCVDSKCFSDADCASPHICNTANGQCVLECSKDAQCSPSFHCSNNRCVPRSTGPLSCPDDMSSIADVFCMDRYEASRQDANANNSGLDDAVALSRRGVLPWKVDSNALASGACAAAGKRLCGSDEWELACSGLNRSEYIYGDVYDAATCNGIDAFGRDNFHLATTGAFASCVNEWGIYDLNGNLWEHVANGDDMHVRGGAFNCSDSERLHRCRYIPGSWSPSARGFRCCANGASNSDGGMDAHGGNDAHGEDILEDGGGCIDPDAGPTDRNSDAGGNVHDARVDAVPTDTKSDLATVSDVGRSDSQDEDTINEDVSTACPDDMSVINRICMDRYEASREDATETHQGTSTRIAQSRAGVLPWYVNPMTPDALVQFGQACVNAGKRLCSQEEWHAACTDNDARSYFTGNSFDPSLCNSVDSYCQTCCDVLGDIDLCPLSENCGYNTQLSSSPYLPETCGLIQPYDRNTCHVCFHLMPTAAFSQCHDDKGLYDINGNLWEVVSSSTDPRGYQLRGGAFNCGSPSTRFRCEYNATWQGLWAGFRCCKDWQ